jgi:hypothetical protein
MRSSRTVVLWSLLLALPAAGCGRPKTLALAAFMVEAGGLSARRLAEGSAAAGASGAVRFAGATTQPCHVVLLAFESQIVARRLDGPDDAPALPVAAGEFRIAGDRAFDLRPGPLRVFAFCGGADLRYRSLADAAEGQLRTALAAGSGDVSEALRGLERVDGLAPEVAQATALFRLMP